MGRLGDFLKYQRNKRFIKKYESNPENYEGNRVKTLIANEDYCNAVADVIIYENDREITRIANEDYCNAVADAIIYEGDREMRKNIRGLLKKIKKKS